MGIKGINNSIDSSRITDGDRLADDLLRLPKNLSVLEGRYFYYPELDSTMNTASEMALNGCPHFTVIAAETQRGGRGRQGRKWISEKGGLYFSIVLRPEIEPELCFRINFMVSAVLAVFLREKYGIEAFCKWPNDIIADGGKLAGMISESMIEDGRLRYLVVGIGINVNNELPVEAGQPVTSIRHIKGSIVSVRDFLIEFFQRLELAFQNFHQTDWIEETRKLSATTGRRVRIENPAGCFFGVASGINDDGSLSVTLENGDIINVNAGDCIHSFKITT